MQPAVLSGQPTVLPWFIKHIEAFAPAGWRSERQHLYAELLALQPATSPTLYDHVGLFVLAQILAVYQLATPPAAKKRPARASAHATWYEQERQRVARLLRQIAESPIVSGFQATVTYYDAADVTCQHGRNQKTCEELYALRLTLHLLERAQPSPWVRTQVERLRQREPHLPQLNALCAPLAPPESAPEPAPRVALTAAAPDDPPDELTAYLLGTIVGRLRHAGLTVARSCALVDRILLYCFDRPDPGGTRPTILAAQWQRLHRQTART